MPQISPENLGQVQSDSAPLAGFNPYEPIQSVMNAGVATQIKTKKRAPITALIIIAIILIGVGVTAAMVFHRSDQELITSRINTLESAYNDGDIQKLISCFDPKTQTALKAVSDLSIFGINVSDLLGMAVGLSSFMGNNTTVTITIHDIRLTSKTSAEVDITFVCGTIENEECTLIMMKSGLNWYIDMSNESLF